MRARIARAPGSVAGKCLSTDSTSSNCLRLPNTSASANRDARSSGSACKNAVQDGPNFLGVPGCIPDQAPEGYLVEAHGSQVNEGSELGGKFVTSSLYAVKINELSSGGDRARVDGDGST